MKNRLKCAWNCLRGRPTMYRMRIADGVAFREMNHAICVENDFRGGGIGPLTSTNVRIFGNTVGPQ